MRQRIKMMSVNQMCCYHTILEAYNVIRNSSSEQIKIRSYNLLTQNTYLFLKTSVRLNTYLYKFKIGHTRYTPYHKTITAYTSRHLILKTITACVLIYIQENTYLYTLILTLFTYLNASYGNN